MKRLLLVFVLLAVTAIPLGTRVQAQSGGTLRAGLDVDAGSGDPRLMNDTSAFKLMDLVYDGLVVLDPTLTPQPALATSWDNPDPMTWVFHLREGVTFHDGTPFTADDVVFTFTTILDENFAAPYRSNYTSIDSVTATDPQTVEFKLTGPYAPFLSYMDIGIVPKHIAEAADNDLANNPVGTGPFTFVSWERNSKIELKANPTYWGGAPKLEGVTLFIIPDNTVRATSLETGDLDLIHSPLSPQDVDNLKNVDGVTVTEQTALGYTYLNFNIKDPILADVKVRQGIAHLIDKNTISSEIYQGMDIPGKSPLVPGTWWYADVPDQAFDPAAAAALFTEAGWTKNGDGIYEKDGQKLTIVLKTHSEDPNRIQVIEYLQNVFSENGINASVETTEWPTYIAAVQQNDYQIALIGWLRLIDPDYAMFAQFTCNGGLNWGGYCDPDLDTLLKEGRENAVQAKRAEIYNQVATKVVDQVYYSVLLYQGYIVATQSNVTGFVPNPSGSWKSLAVTSLS